MKYRVVTKLYCLSSAYRSPDTSLISPWREKTHRRPVCWRWGQAKEVRDLKKIHFVFMFHWFKVHPLRTRAFFTELHRYHCQRVNECALTRNISDLLQIIYGVGGPELRDLSYDVTIWCQMSTKVQGRFPIDRFHKEPQTHVEELHPCPIYIYFSFPIDFESLACFLLEHAIFLLLAVKIIRPVDHQQKTELEEQTFG